MWAVLICVPEIFVNDATSDLLCLFKELGVISVHDGGLVVVFDDGSEGGFIGILFAGVDNDVFHGSKILCGRFNDLVLESRESINRCLSL